MQFKSGVGSIKTSNPTPLKKNLVLQSVIALLVLTPLLVPMAAYATRSQTANTTPGADVSSIAAVAAAEAPRPSNNNAGSASGSNGSDSNNSGSNGTRAGNSADIYSPSAEPPDKSTDRGFSTDDFLHPDDGTVKPKKAVVTFASTRGPERVKGYNLLIKINVPQNTDPVDRFVAYPYPMPVPIPRRPPGTKGQKSSGSSGEDKDKESKPAIAPQAYDQMPSTRGGIRDLILQTGYTNRTKRNVAYPSGGWRWQMAYRNALAKCNRSEPTMIGGMYGFVDAMEPLVKAECEKFDELEEDRQRRYQTAFEEFQLNRNECEYDAVKKGYFPVEFNMSRAYRGVIAAAVVKLKPGTWWITGTHKVVGLTYYWQQPVQIVDGNVENVELNWKNALVIQGGW